MAEIKSINGYTIKDETARNTMIYSETPVKVGEWIDGTPIWRQAFDRTITDNEISAGEVSEVPSVKSYDGVFILDSMCMGYITAEGHSLYDDETCPAINQLYTFSLENFENMQSGTYSVSGWMIFVTEESNIKS